MISPLAQAAERLAGRAVVSQEKVLAKQGQIGVVKRCKNYAACHGVGTVPFS